MSKISNNDPSYKKKNSPNSGVKKNLKTVQRMLPINFHLQLEPIEIFEKKRKFSSDLNAFQNFRSTKGKFKFRCYQEERKRKSEAKRQKIIQKLKKNYEICVDGFNKNVTDEIIKKVEFIEKENKEREKKHLERTMIMIKKLLEDQKLKRKGLNPSLTYNQQKKMKTVLPCLSNLPPPKKTKDEEKSASNDQKLTPPQAKLDSPTDSLPSFSKNISIAAKEDAQPKLFGVERSVENVEGEELNLEEEFKSIYASSLISSKLKSLEKNLECTPKRIVFENYRSGKVYLQSLKITNTSMENIHCRYLGIAVHAKHEGRFPIGVAVRDSITLRPGLSCSTKIRLCSPNDTNELECTIVYETRKQSKPLKHSFFFIPILCLPARAIVHVLTPKIRFPCLTWSAAIAPESYKYQKKSVIIKNSGGRECFCKIVSTANGCINGSEKNENEVEFLEPDKVEELSIISNEKNQHLVPPSCEAEEFQKDDLTLCQNALNTSKELINELFDNVFAIFRFDYQYNIVIPPFSTKQIDVRFIPEYKGFHQETYIIQFDGCHNLEEATIELTGDIKKLPLIVDPTLLDLKICIINSGVYAAKFTVFNTSKKPFPISLRLPRGLLNHADLYPKGTILQMASSCEFSIRLYPRLTLNRDAGEYFNEDTGVLEFPIFIYPSNYSSGYKTDYIKIYVFAVITNYSLELSPSTIDFGCVNTLETVRAPIKVINHSLAVQEYGFLNLPKGVRVEPNMGFGFILPKETISLFMLYSPSVGLIDKKGFKKNEKHSFEIKITTVAEYGGLGDLFVQQLEPDSFESIWGEWSKSIKTLYSDSSDSSVFHDEPQSEGNDEIYKKCSSSEFLLKMKNLRTNTNDETNKIKQYIKFGCDELSEHSFFKKINMKFIDDNSPNMVEPSQKEDSTLIRSSSSSQDKIFKYKMNTVQCEALIREPNCQMSESVIQLPSTPCSSFSLYRFNLKGWHQPQNSNCWAMRQKKSKNVKENFRATFQFKNICPDVKLEPQSGYFKSGEKVPITIIYAPEFPVSELCRESRVQKAKRMEVEKFIKETSTGTQAKGRKFSEPSKKTPLSVTNANAINDINTPFYELEKCDLFAGERSLQELAVPFCKEVKISCVIEIKHDGDENFESTEIHDIVLICPVVKPKFINKGTSQEIDFGKVYVGTKARAFIEIQNVSLERIRPVMSLINPVGPFVCLSALRKIFIDPEHILRHPLIYCPLENEGSEKEFFELYCGSTNVRLLAKGEAVKPSYKLTPNYGCCVLESKIGSAEEFKLEVENLSQIKMNLKFLVDFIKEEVDLKVGLQTSENHKENVSVSGSTDKKKKGESEKKNFNGWSQTPDEIMNELKKFQNISLEKYFGMFDLKGVSDKSEVTVPPFGKTSVKIKFTPPLISKQAKGELSPIIYKKYAINYKIMLENSIVLKEILVIGAASK